MTHITAFHLDELKSQIADADHRIERATTELGAQQARRHRLEGELKALEQAIATVERLDREEAAEGGL